MDVGYMPVMIEERFVAQTGQVVKACEKRMPRAARASRVGVIASFEP